MRTISHPKTVLSKMVSKEARAYEATLHAQIEKAKTKGNITKPIGR